MSRRSSHRRSIFVFENPNPYPELFSSRHLVITLIEVDNLTSDNVHLNLSRQFAFLCNGIDIVFITFESKWFYNSTIMKTRTSQKNSARWELRYFKKILIFIMMIVDFDIHAIDTQIKRIIVNCRIPHYQWYTIWSRYWFLKWTFLHIVNVKILQIIMMIIFYK